MIGRRALLCIALALAACDRGTTSASGPTCGVVGLRFITVARAELAHVPLDGPAARATASQLVMLRARIVSACVAGAWSAAVRDCLVAAADHVHWQACEIQLTDAQRLAIPVAD
jgi:hypothetical protein